MKALKRLNDALPALVVTILIYGVVVELIGIWFAEDKIRYTTGLLIGIACAIFMAIHLAIVIRDAVEQSSERRLKFKSVSRYIVIVIVFFVMMYFKLGNLISAFIGVLGLKVSAYLQPFIHKKILHDLQEYEPLEDSEEEVKP